MAEHPLTKPAPHSVIHPLIAVQLDGLRAQLPPALAEEIADGLNETYQTQLSRLGNPDVAARAAIAEFGDTRTITRAAWRQSTLRGRAVLLLATAPLVGTAWAASLLNQPQWTSSIPIPVRAVLGVTLLTVAIALLLATAVDQMSYRYRTRTVHAASLLVLALDVAVCAATLSHGPTAVRVIQVAVVASLARGTSLALPMMTRLLRAGAAGN
jgi:hypothetical protein